MKPAPDKGKRMLCYFHGGRRVVEFHDTFYVSVDVSMFSGPLNMKLPVKSHVGTYLVCELRSHQRVGLTFKKSLDLGFV